MRQRRNVSSQADVRTISVGARPLHALVRAYRFAFAARPSPCRFEPSCSSYALEALERHGAVRGSWLILRRLGRCHPFGGWGWDPVPLPKAHQAGNRSLANPQKVS